MIPEKGKKAVFAIINDPWRRYKCTIKKEHFSKYKNLNDRLKNRPQEIPEADFRELLEYWRLESVQVRYKNLLLCIILVSTLFRIINFILY